MNHQDVEVRDSNATTNNPDSGPLKLTQKTVGVSLPQSLKNSFQMPKKVLTNDEKMVKFLEKKLEDPDYAHVKGFLMEEIQAFKDRIAASK